MGHIKEPVGIDLVVAPMPLSEEDRQTVSAVIEQYKQTKEVPKSNTKFRKTLARKKATHRLSPTDVKTRMETSK